MRSVDEILPALNEYEFDPMKVKWVCTRFHPESEVQDFSSVDKNEKACELSKVTTDLSDEETEEIAAIFFRLLDEINWELFLSIESQVVELLRELRSPLSDLTDDKKVMALERKTKYSGHIRELKREMDELMKEITSGETEAERIVRKAMRRQSIGPEAMARRYQKE